MQSLRGLPASPGIALGTAFVYKKQTVVIDTTPPTDGTAELARAQEALAGAKADLESMAERMEDQGRGHDAEILHIQIEFLEDPSYGEEILSVVKAGTYRAAHAIDFVSKNLVAEFSEIEDEYFRDRMNDIKDLAARLLNHVSGITHQSLENLEEPVIILAEDLTPSDTVLLDPKKALALGTELGSATSHTAILSRSLGIPSLVGIGKHSVPNGASIIIDALSGKLIVDPTDEVLAEYRVKFEEYEAKKARLLATAGQPAITADGRPVEVAANIGTLTDARQAVSMGADGVGLLRTEFLFLERTTLPTEDEQFTQYRDIVQALGDRPLVVRTLDVGGDKHLPSVDMPVEQNPFLGQRAIRLAMTYPDKLLIPQLRALLRAAAGKDLRIMFPMVSRPVEFVELKAQVQDLITQLAKEGKEHNPNPKLGIMIEIPSAAVTADLFAPLVDFFSIGTNDLTQYVLAVDRTNETIAHIADYCEPAVIRLIDSVIQAGHAAGKWVGMCGEMAGDPAVLPVLLALGLDEFSMAPIAIPDIKDRIRRLDTKALVATAQAVRKAGTPEEVRRLSAEAYKN